MGKCEKLLLQALSGSQNLRFEDLCALAECYGFALRRGGGTSHRVFKRPGYFRILNFQNARGQAKPYQVNDLLNALRDLGEIDDE
jgi:hypothetical protein